MKLLKVLLKSKLIWAAILVPMAFQTIFLYLVVPALVNEEDNISNIIIDVVNKDNDVGVDIVNEMEKNLPFTFIESDDLNGSLNRMDKGINEAVIFIPGGFTKLVEEGSAELTYYINQQAPSLTKEMIEGIAIQFNYALNEIAFEKNKEAVLQDMNTQLSEDDLSEAMKEKMSKSFESLKYQYIELNVDRVHDSKGFIQAILPFFMILISFIAAVFMTAVQSIALKSLQEKRSKWALFSIRQGLNVFVSILIPIVMFSALSVFNIPYKTSIIYSWLTLSAGFFATVSLVQIFFYLFGTIGMAIGNIFVFPLQLVTSALMFPKEIFPPFYTCLRTILPSTYFGTGMLKVFYGGPYIINDFLVLLLMAMVFITVSACTVFFKREKSTSEVCM